MAERVRVEVDGDARGLQRAAASAVASIKGISNEAKRSDVQMRASARESDRLGAAFGRSRVRSEGLGNSLLRLKLIGGALAFGPAVSGLNAMAASSVAMLGSLGPLTGLLATLPGGIAGLVTASGTWGLATADLKKALGGLNEELDTDSKAFKKLSPEGQRFARVLQSMKPQVQDLQKTAQKGLFPGLESGLRSASKNLPVVDRIIGRTSRLMGGLAAQFGKQLGGKEWGRDLEAVGNSNVRVMDDLGRSGINVANTLRHVAVEARPLTEWLGRLALGWSRTRNEQARAGRESGRLGAYFERTRQTVSRMLSILGHLGRGMLGVFRAGRRDGDSLWRSVDRLAIRFDRWANSLRGQEALAQWFANGRLSIEAAGRAVQGMINRFHQLRREGQSTSQALATVLARTISNAIAKATEQLAAHAPAIAKGFVQGFLAADVWGQLLVGGWVLAKFGALGAVFSRVGATSGLLFAGGFQRTAKKGIALDLAALGGGGAAAAAGGAAGGGVARGLKSRLAGLAPALKTLGKLTIGAALVSGAVAGFTAKDVNFGGKLAAALRSATFGLTPDIKREAETATRNALRSIGQGKGFGAGAQPKQKRSFLGVDALAKDSTGLKHLSAQIKRDLGSLDQRVRTFQRTGSGFGAIRRDLLRFAASRPQLAGAVNAMIRDLRRLGTASRARNFTVRFGLAVSQDRPNVRKAVNTLLAETDRLPRSARKAALRTALGMASELRSKGKLSGDQARHIRRRIVAQLDAMARESTDAAARAARGTNRKMIGLANAINSGIISTFGAVSTALQQFGLKPIVFKAGRATSGGKNIPKLKPLRELGRARGGVVQFGRPGARGRDTIPATMGETKIAVGSGEVGMVATRHQQADLNQWAREKGYRSLPDYFKRRNTKHFMAGGGIADGRIPAAAGLEGVKPAAASIARWAGKRYRATVTSGKRSGGGGSHHDQGNAVDLVSGDMKKMGLGIWRAFGRKLEELIHTPMGFSVDGGRKTAPFAQASHYNHVHAAALGKALAAGFGGDVNLKRILLSGPAGPLRQLGQAQLDTVRKAGQRYLDAKSAAAGGESEGAHPGKGVATRSQMVGWARKALLSTGKPPTAENINKILSLARKESGWRVDSINNWDSNAKAGNPSGGLMHVTMDKVGRSRRRLFDPVANMIASIRYQYSQYGGLITHSPYARGGLVPGGDGASIADHFASLPGFAAGGVPLESEVERARGKAEKLRGKKGKGKKRKFNKAREQYRKLRNARRTGLRRRSRGQRKLTGELAGMGLPTALIGAFDKTGERIVDLSDIFDQREGLARSDEILSQPELNELLGRKTGILHALAGRDGKGGQLGLGAAIKARIETARSGLQRFIDRMVKRVRENMAKLKKKVARAKRIREDLARLSKKKRKTRTDRRRAQKLESELLGIRRQVPGLEADNTFITGEGRPASTRPEGVSAGVLSDARAQLERLGEEGERFRGELRPGGLPAAVSQTNLDIIGLRREGATKPEWQGQQADLVKEQLAQVSRKLAISQAQFEVFKDFAPQVRGSFAHGTRRVRETGLYELHRDEQVLTDSRGAYGSQQPARGAAAPNVDVRVIVHGDAAALIDRFDVMVDRKLVRAKVEQGRRNRMTAAAPGRR